MSRPVSHWLLLFALVAMWGSAFLLIKVAVAEIGPSTVVAGRLLLAALVLIVVVILSGRSIPWSGRSLFFYFAIAVAGNCLPFWLITWGEQEVGAGLAGVLMAIMPLTTLVLAHFFVEGERLNRIKFLGFLIGFLGIVILVGPDALREWQGTGTAFRAQLAIIAAAVCYAANTIIARKRPRADPLVSAAGTLIAGSLLMTPLALATESPWQVDLTGTAALAVLILGLVSTALATVTFFKVIDLAGPTFLSLINYLIPVWALFGAITFLDEQAEWSAFLALALILAGIALAETLGRRQVKA